MNRFNRYGICLIAVIGFLCLPAAAFADSVTAGFQNGGIFTSGVNPNEVLTNVGAPASWISATSIFSGTTFTLLPPGPYGALTFTTGHTAGTYVFAPSTSASFGFTGSSISLVSTGLDSIFTGAFTGAVSLVCGTASCTMSGPVSGLVGGQDGTIFSGTFSNTVFFDCIGEVCTTPPNTATLNVNSAKGDPPAPSVPEPGTLGMLAASLLGLGFLASRRRVQIEQA